MEPEAEFYRLGCFRIPFRQHICIADQDIFTKFENGSQNVRSGPIRFSQKSKMADGGHVALLKLLRLGK